MALGHCFTAYFLNAGKARETWAPPREMDEQKENNRGVNRGSFQDCIFHGWRAGADAHRLADTETDSWTRRLPKAQSRLVSCCSPFTSRRLSPLCSGWIPADYHSHCSLYSFTTPVFSRKICVIICLNGSGANAWKTRGVRARRWNDATSRSHVSKGESHENMSRSHFTNNKKKKKGFIINLFFILPVF